MTASSASASPDRPLSFHEHRRDLERNLWRTIDKLPALVERLRAGRREERIYGTGHQPHFFRRSYGPGWALVGDAGHNKDAITAQGIGDAFRDAELLAEALDDAFAGRLPLESALERYAHARDEATLPMYEFTTNMARLAPPTPDEAAQFAAIAADPAASSGFLGLFAGTVQVAEFMAPVNIERICEPRSTTQPAELRLRRSRP